MTRAIPADLFPKPFWFPQMLDRGQDWTRLVRFRRSDYMTAPFLDQRGLRDGMRFVTLPWDAVCDAVPPDARTDSHWIFHISHVGSTLLSRLLAGLGGLLPLREPLIALSALDLPAARRAERIGPTVRLLSRTFAPGERALVKATSAVSDIAGEIMGVATGRAIALRMSPENYVAARLSGNLADLRGRGNSRRLRLERKIGTPLDTALLDDPPLLAALSWACEAAALEQLALSIDADRLMFVDFDDFLRDHDTQLGGIAAHLGLDVEPSAVRSVVTGPLMRANAKDPVSAFDPSRRTRRLAAAAADLAEAIATARRWLDSVGATAPLVAAALDRTA